MPMCLLHYLSGAFTHQARRIGSKIGSKAGDLIKRSFDDIDPARLVDYHTHVAGIGTGATACSSIQKCSPFRWRERSLNSACL